MAPTYSRPYHNYDRNNEERNPNYRQYEQRSNYSNDNRNDRNYNDRNYNRNNDNERRPRKNNNNDEPVGELTFKRDFEPKDLRGVKHTLQVTTIEGKESTTEITTVYLPQYPAGGTAWMLVYVVSAFNNEKEVMGWKTPAKLYEKFGMQVEDKEEWNGCIKEEKKDYSEKGFYTAVGTLLTTKFSSNAWDNHTQFLQNYKKPPSMTPQELYSGFRQHNNVLPGLPGAPTDGTPAKFTPHQMKTNVFNTMPQWFKNSFISAGKSLADMKINDIVSYMEGLYKMEQQNKRIPYKPRNNNYHNKRPYHRYNDDRPRYDNNRYENNNDRRYEPNRDQRNGNSNNDSNDRRIENNHNEIIDGNLIEAPTKKMSNSSKVAKYRKKAAYYAQRAGLEADTMAMEEYEDDDEYDPPHINWNYGG